MAGRGHVKNESSSEEEDDDQFYYFNDIEEMAKVNPALPRSLSLVDLRRGNTDKRRDAFKPFKLDYEYADLKRSHKKGKGN